MQVAGLKDAQARRVLGRVPHRHGEGVLVMTKTAQIGQLQPADTSSRDTKPRRRLPGHSESDRRLDSIAPSRGGRSSCSIPPCPRLITAPDVLPEAQPARRGADHRAARAVAAAHPVLATVALHRRPRVVALQQGLEIEAAVALACAADRQARALVTPGPLIAGRCVVALTVVQAAFARTIRGASVLPRLTRCELTAGVKAELIILTRLWFELEAADAGPRRVQVNALMARTDDGFARPRWGTDHWRRSRGLADLWLAPRRKPTATA